MIDTLKDKELNARLQVVLKNFRCNESTRKVFSKRIYAELTYHSTAIEGSTLTLDEVKSILEGKGDVPDKPELHSWMVRDHHDALMFVENSVRHDHRLTVNFISAIGAHVMRTTGSAYKTVLGEYDESKGDLRLNNVSADGHYFINYDNVPAALQAFVLTTENDLKEAISRKDSSITALLNVAWKAHYEFLKIHPFGDGNGRTARLLMAYVLMRLDMPICLVCIEDRAEYISILRSETNQSIQLFSNFMTHQYFKTLGVIS